MGNTQVFSITNDYAGSRSPLECCKTDQENVQNLCSEMKVKHDSTHNFYKKMLLEKLEFTQQIRIKRSTGTSTCIVYISGHGSYNASNSISNFYSFDKEELPITSILTFFSDYENIFVIVDTCLVNSPKLENNIIKIHNKGNVVISYSTKPFATSAGTSKGSYFTNAFIKAIKRNKYDNLTLKNWLLINGATHIFYKDRGQISISANKNVRDTIEYKKVMESLNIEYVSNITEVNKKASNHIAKKDQKNLFINQTINSINALFQALDKIDDVNIHYAILSSLSLKTYECDDLSYLNIMKFAAKHLDLETQIVNYVCKKIVFMELDTSSKTVRLDILSILKKIPNNLKLNSTDQEKELKILKILTMYPEIKNDVNDYLKKNSFV